METPAEDSGLVEWPAQFNSPRHQPPHHFTTSPLHHFTTSPLHHFTASPLHRFIASLTRPIAVSIARILLSVSFHSISGTESITIPAAACTLATPSAITHVRIVIARFIRAPPDAM